jgi:tetratricopeptide (TPR) repeat protein
MSADVPRPTSTPATQSTGRRARQPLTILSVDQSLGKWLAKRQFAQALAWLNTISAEQEQPELTLPLELRRVRMALAGNLMEQAAVAAQRAREAGGADGLCFLALALAAHLEQRWEDALQLLEQGMQQGGTTPGLYLEQGELLQKLGRHSEAALALEAAVNLMPDNLRAQKGLAAAVIAQGNHARAARIIAQLVSRAPRTIEAQSALAYALLGLQLLPQALQAFECVSTLEPDKPGPWVNRGALLSQLGRRDEAMQAYERAIALDPASAAPYYNRGNILRVQEHMEEALQDYDRALSHAPGDGLVHWNKAITLLTMGRVAEGFAEYEWRWESPQFPSKKRRFVQPCWEGEALAGKTLLVHAEQGQGDVLQFLRFVPSLAASGARVVLEVHPPLKTLVAAQALPGVIRVVGAGDPLPAFDLHVAIGSLPHRLGIDLQSLSGAAYLRAPARAPLAPVTPGSALHRLLGQGDGRLRVGLIWAGNPSFSGDRQRSMQFAQVQPLLGLPGVEWYSLQKGYAEAQVPADAALNLLGPELSDWGDTAKAMQALDLVVTTCTATAHLAGALGKGTWVLLAYDADWRWMLRERTDSPWYASARLFRQAGPGDWNGVIERVAEALSAKLACGPASRAV